MAAILQMTFSITFLAWKLSCIFTILLRYVFKVSSNNTPALVLNRQQALICRNYTPRTTKFYTPRTTKLLGGILVSLRPSVRLSVRPSVCPSRLPCPLCNIYSSGWILPILATNDHYHVRVCRTQWPLTLTYIFKVIRPWLRKSCPLCSVYSSKWILFIFGTNDHYHWRVCRLLLFFRIWKFEFLANF